MERKYWPHFYCQNGSQLTGSETNMTANIDAGVLHLHFTRISVQELYCTLLSSVYLIASCLETCLADDESLYHF